jgi:hypothetical protein
MSTQCPHCGATLTTDETCEDRFNAGQLLEVADPAYYAVHQFSVCCYMLQHNRYSQQGWLGARALLVEFVQGVTPQTVRRRDRQKVDSGQRTWSITKGPKLPGVEHIHWTYTVADVRLDTAEHYCADVRQWAKYVLADSAALVEASHA